MRGRALRAALAIQEGLEPLRADVQRTQGRDFRMRIGINTGPVVAGSSAGTCGWTTRRWVTR